MLKILKKKCKKISKHVYEFQQKDMFLTPLYFRYCEDTGTVELFIHVIFQDTQYEAEITSIKTPKQLKQFFKSIAPNPIPQKWLNDN